LDSEPVRVRALELQAAVEVIEEATAAAPKPAGDAQISEVRGFRMFKENVAQWHVRWTADDAVSWETFDKLDSEPVRVRALELQAADAGHCDPDKFRIRIPSAGGLDEPTSVEDTDIACAIDKLDYLQVIPECRDDVIRAGPIKL
jgi:hypothetical protein